MRRLAGSTLRTLASTSCPDGENVGGLVYAGPGDIGHVQQGVHAADVHESAVIGQAADRAVHGLAFLDFGVAALLGGALFVFQDRAAVHHHVFIGYVELDDAAAGSPGR